MISSMGNAFTFPLQTMIFACVLHGCYRAYGIKPVRIGGSADNWGVFGDDIICRTEVFDLLCRTLAHAGFSVNMEKSFNQGLFRESCGQDFHFGYNVRGVYCKSLRDIGDYYSLINRLNHWSATHGVPLPRTISYLLKKVPFNGVPFDESDDAGIKVPFSLLKHPKVHRKNWITLVNYYRYRPIPAVIKVPGDEVRREGPFKEVLNLDGLLLAAVAGRLRDNLLNLRIFKRKIAKTKGRTPRWDYVPLDRSLRIGAREYISRIGANLVN